MSLVGTYQPLSKQFTLIITESTVSNGTFSGSFKTTDAPEGEATVPINGRFRYVNGTGQPTNMEFSGLNAGGPNSNAVAWTGYTNEATPDEIKLAGSTTYIRNTAVSGHVYPLDVFYRV